MNIIYTNLVNLYNIISMPSHQLKEVSLTWHHHRLSEGQPLATSTHCSCHLFVAPNPLCSTQTQSPSCRTGGHLPLCYCDKQDKEHYFFFFSLVCTNIDRLQLYSIKLGLTEECLNYISSECTNTTYEL